MSETALSRAAKVILSPAFCLGFLMEMASLAVKNKKATLRLHKRLYCGCQTVDLSPLDNKLSGGMRHHSDIEFSSTFCDKYGTNDQIA